MYTILVDDINVMGNDISSCIIEPTVTVALDKAGSAEFTIPPGHPAYNVPKVMKSNVEIHEIDKDGNDDVIFYGRVSSITKDWFNRKKIVCEGMLAFLNDTIQRYHKYNSKTTTLKGFFEALIDNHNEFMMNQDVNRVFYIGDNETTGILIKDKDGNDISTKKVYRLTNYETTLDDIVNMCLDAEGGHIFTERRYIPTHIQPGTYDPENPVTPGEENDDPVIIYEWANTIWWYSDMLHGTSDQPIQFALNLLDIQEEFDNDEFYTALLPLGATDPNTDKPITIKSVNNNSDYIQDDDMVNLYGFILKVKEWSDISKPSKLKKKAQDWMSTERFDKLMITCNAADLSILDPNYSKFRVGAKVRVTSAPHGLDKVYPISEIIYHLESGKKEITVGTQERKTLSYITKKGNEEYRMPDAYYDEDPDPDEEE